MKPTGIAIYEANARGFKSVAHYLQAQWKARNGGSAAGMEVDGDTKAEGTAKAEEVELGGSASSAASKTCVQAESPQPSGEQSALASKRPSAAVASSRLVLAKERKRLVAL